MARAKAASQNFSFSWLIWTVALLIVAWATVGTEVDFAVQRRPQLADSVPDAFRNFAPAVEARNALLANDGTNTVSQATELLSRRPIPAENLSLLASGMMLEKSNRVGPVLQAGVTRGWRDMLLQLAALDGALQTRNWEVAIQRLTALRTMRRPKEFIDPVVEQIVQNPQGRRAYAAFLKGSPVETAGFIRDGLDFLDSATYTNVILMAAKDGAKFDCDQMANATDRLLRNNAGQNARQLWPKRCATVSSNQAGMMTFPSSTVENGPFDWQYPSEPGLMRDYRGNGPVTTLSFSNSDSLKRILAKRFLTLAPGQHSITMQDREGGSVSDIDVLVACLGKGARASVSRAANGIWNVTIPPEGCSVQQLRLRVPQGSGEIAQVLVK
ncbi:hypothetical protein GRI39_13460 [Altererythrobacter indicus]|uniref:Uncharacterized protein n=1 Tax=Altericroceibacterium indicum TaxID=374177 RepID=A0A845AE10_9SPHN|nr:hypothetical protein [Altericroceibacterium indicum]MXP27035.1 hypothetical protein [Altericroceibacterium indicum]